LTWVALAGSIGDAFPLQRRSADAGFDFFRTPQAFILTGPLWTNCRVEPTQFRATI